MCTFLYVIDFGIRDKNATRQGVCIANRLCCLDYSEKQLCHRTPLRMHCRWKSSTFSTLTLGCCFSCIILSSRIQCWAKSLRSMYLNHIEYNLYNFSISFSCLSSSYCLANRLKIANTAQDMNSCTKSFFSFAMASFNWRMLVMVCFEFWMKQYKFYLIVTYDSYRIFHPLAIEFGIKICNEYNVLTPWLDTY